jgi:hypothetical protein
MHLLQASYCCLTSLWMWHVNLLHVYEPLRSSRSTCYISHPLRLCIPHSLQAHCHFFFSEGSACDICDAPCLPSPCLSSYGNYSNCSCCLFPKAIHPEWYPDKVQAGPGVPPSSVICFLDSSCNTRLLNCAVTAYNTHQLTTVSSCCIKISLG